MARRRRSSTSDDARQRRRAWGRRCRRWTPIRRRGPSPRPRSRPTRSTPGSVWRPSEELSALRRLVAQRTRIVRERTRFKNSVQAVLHRNLVSRCPAADLFGRKGRSWLAEQDLPADERILVASALRRLDVAGEADDDPGRGHGGGDLARGGHRRRHPLCKLRQARELPGPGPPRAPVGQPARPPRAYLQAGALPGPGHAGRGRLGLRQDPGAASGVLRARARTARRAGGGRGHSAKARRPVLADAPPRRGLRLARPSLIVQKRRTLELKAGAPSRRGQRGSTYRYNLKDVREAERAMSQQAEIAYEKLTARWTKSPAASGAGAAKGVRL
jgi:transposase